MGTSYTPFGCYPNPRCPCGRRCWWGTLVPPARHAQTLVDALWHDPFYVAITPAFAHAPTERRVRLARYFACSLHEAEQLGAVIVPQGDGYGAAAWLFP